MEDTAFTSRDRGAGLDKNRKASKICRPADET
jgi:hypothetical protein